MPSTRRAPALLAALLVPLLAPAPAKAAITPEARAVVERFVEALGGRAAVADQRTLHTKSTIEAFGFTGTVESWMERPDRSASVTALGPFTLRDGTGGGRAWRVDQNGKFSWRDGRDLEEEQAGAWFENERWLDPDQGGGSITVRGSERDSAGAWTVLTIAPPVGRARAFWFAQGSGLLERIELQADQHTVVTHLSDYRRAAGRLRPHRQDAQAVGMPLNRLVATLDSVWVNEAIPPARFAPPAEQARDFRFLRGGAVARLPMRYGERHVWVKVSVNGGPPVDFLLDTGASVTVLDSAWAAGQGIAAEGRGQAIGAGAAGGVSFARVDTLRVAGPDGDGVELTSQKVAVLSLNPHIAPFFWRETAGVLGYDFISRFVVEIDYDLGTLALHEPGTFTYAGRGSGLPLKLAGSIPVVAARLDGRYEGEFRVDVGSGSTVDLHGPFVERHGLREKAGRALEVMGGGFGGTFTSHLVRMQRFEIGPFGWDAPLVILSGATHGGLASVDYAGNIGNEILERFRCTFDYERRMLYLEPGPRYTKRDRFSRAGAQLARHGDEVRAAQVLPGSPAAEAGLEPGDRIVALDGRPILEFTPDRLTEMFEEGPEGRRHTLTIERDGRRRRLTLRLRELI